ncbi:MAG: aminoacyl-tRNA hydrolase [Cytophagales bacterium]|jgi:PTH1 family peptidyl-tRNA hydrolase|nr:aminoacyl-tRNA hydrolase [Cytophagales bacterium]
MDFCILGIGNVGIKYEKSRHNTGFILLDKFAKDNNCEFLLKKHAYVANFSFCSHNFYFLKPTTFVNLSGIALNYWREKLKISLENILVIVDDINLDLGQIRFRNSGSSGGHNGLKNISLHLNSDNYKRLRVGIGNNFSFGQQVDYVIKNFDVEELKKILTLAPVVENIIKSFAEQNEKIRMKIINDILAKFH